MATCRGPLRIAGWRVRVLVAVAAICFGVDAVKAGWLNLPLMPPIDLPEGEQFYNLFFSEPILSSQVQYNLYATWMSDPAHGPSRLQLNTSAGIVQRSGNEVRVYALEHYPVLFVTDDVYAVDFFNIIPPIPPFFGSIPAADYHVTAAAYDAGILPEWDFNTLEFHSLLSEPLSYLVNLRLGHTGLVNVRGELIFEPFGDDPLLGNRLAPILTQSGQELTGFVPVWTGVGSVTPGPAGPDAPFDVVAHWGATADNWTDPYNSVAHIGNLNGTGSEWISAGTQSAGNLARLYGSSVLGGDHAITGYELVLVYTVPEPSSWALLVSGLLAAAIYLRRGRSRLTPDERCRTTPADQS